MIASVVAIGVVVIVVVVEVDDDLVPSFVGFDVVVVVEMVVELVRPGVLDGPGDVVGGAKVVVVVVEGVVNVAEIVIMNSYCIII